MSQDTAGQWYQQRVAALDEGSTLTHRTDELPAVVVAAVALGVLYSSDVGSHVRSNT